MVTIQWMKVTESFDIACKTLMCVHGSLEITKQFKEKHSEYVKAAKEWTKKYVIFLSKSSFIPLLSPKNKQTTGTPSNKKSDEFFLSTKRSTGEGF